MTDIPEGYALIPGRSRRNAQAALDATAAAGEATSLVRAVPEGYLVPAQAADHYVNPDAPAPLDDDSGPDEGWKNADIEAWAEDHGIDLAGATKKADMLAAIAAAANKEE